jgi:four helix bundle suffix protein
MTPGFIPPHGRYRNLISYQKAEVVFRNLGRTAGLSFETCRTFCETRSAEVIANIALCLIHQTNYLLDQQIRRLEADFVKNGGIRERMTQARLAYRKKGSGY